MNYDTQGLTNAGIDLVAPFSVDVRLEPELVDLADRDASVLDESITPLEFQSVARILPGRRLSGIVQDLVGDQYFAKVFFGKGARRYWQRELSGAASLARAGLTTPALVNQGALADDQGFVVLYAALDAAVAPDARDQQAVAQVVRSLAQLHERQLIQTDPHLDNFLLSADKLYVVDADGVRPARRLQQQLDNLAAFFAQRAPVCDGQIDQLWSVYLEQRDAYVARMANLDMIRQLTHKQRKVRVRRYLQKTQRNCTEFVRKKSWDREFLCQRSHWPELQRLMWFPQEYFGEGTPLKLGNSATVVRIVVAGTPYIVKRYNIKSVSHRVRRWFKRRARHAWMNGHQLDFLQIPTAKPVALLELKWGWFVGVSYLIMPDVGHTHLVDVLRQQPESFNALAPQVVSILAGLQAAGLVHGDLKGTNLMVADEQVWLIDYDGLASGQNKPTDQNRDVTRFLANFGEQPQQLERWQNLIEEARL